MSKTDDKDEMSQAKTEDDKRRPDYGNPKRVTEIREPDSDLEPVPGI